MSFLSKVRHIASGAVATAVLLCASFATPSSAATVSCPGTTVTTDREFTLTTSSASTCLFYGAGNISGNVQTDPFLTSTIGADFELLDKSDDGSSGLFPNLFVNPGSLTSGKSGSFSFNLPPLDNWIFAIGFKVGSGQLDPDWVVLLLPEGVTSGTWEVTGRQGLSHVNLYGTERISIVPLPAALPLAMSGLAVFGMLGWRRHRRAA